ncbi:cation diffusion facilitator family transporter [Glycomyces algeriensis]|uniref:Cation diffusion facilitator transporter n=1 Tax=Glycomyces algeriensis TaxID=256037 RepID=A0A9W6G955_9ACTN|nr:cation diffusion facilitator family transporter [Glycomyces algeriensis]MDA1365057.1 cation diffusion facilitator family transporter [Glycomyces algeriensis]MDR7349881.1 cation diffusion facilitator family transporter [Glycomyces algeriensis]GLI42592.1 cation diffusion facilitator transporter [Glycomyces algeriensis]
MSDEAATVNSESVLTVLVAALMNLGIALAKLIAGILGGSAAMVSEAAHSAADTVTQVMLYIALRNSAKPADDRHPFGYGSTAYLWAALAAALTFVAGGLFSITHGFHSLHEGAEGDFLLSYIVLGISFVLEAVSFGRTIVQLRHESERWSVRPRTFLRHTPDTSLKAVFLEDLAALIGLVLAATGLALTEATGNPVFDGTASILIGVLLLVVAVTLGHANVSLLIGKSLPPRFRGAVRSELEGGEHITAVQDLLTLQLGPTSVIIAAKIDFSDSASGDQIERTCRELEARLRERFPMVMYVFLSPWGEADPRVGTQAD